jgi:2-oxoglutarate ferredoxin oxidoreductase subunit beta
MAEVFKAAVAHKGVSFIEVYQNCNIFNDKAWEAITDREWREERQLFLDHGQPMVFGKHRDKGIRILRAEPEVVSLADVDESEILVHDAHAENSHLAYMLSRMQYPDFPVPMGVLRAIQRPAHDEAVLAQIEESRALHGAGRLRDLYRATETWTVEAMRSNGHSNGHAGA